MAATKKTPSFDHLKGAMDGSGFEDIKMETMAIPFIKIIQDLSPQMKRSKPEFNPEAEPGMFVNTVSGKLYKGPIKVIIGKFERMFLEWGTTRGTLVGVHSPESIELNSKLMRDDKNQLFDPQTQSTFQDCYTYYVLVADDLDEGVCIFSMTSTNIKEAKKLNRNLLHTLLPNTDQRAMPYFMLWEVSSVEKKNDQGEWFGASFKFDSFVTQLQLEAVVEERKQIPKKHVDYAQIEDKSSENTQY